MQVTTEGQDLCAVNPLACLETSLCDSKLLVIVRSEYLFKLRVEDRVDDKWSKFCLECDFVCARV